MTGVQETHEAFKKHFDEQLNLYSSINAVTLVELTGKEKVIGDAYLDNKQICDCVMQNISSEPTQLLKREIVPFKAFLSPHLNRGMKFENVSILTSGVRDIIKHMRYCCNIMCCLTHLRISTLEKSDFETWASESKIIMSLAMQA
ncbi:Phosphatidylinositide phosphatase SAC2 [Mactra antiquata]